MATIKIFLGESPTKTISFCSIYSIWESRSVVQREIVTVINYKVMK